MMKNVSSDLGSVSQIAQDLLVAIAATDQKLTQLKSKYGPPAWEKNVTKLEELDDDRL